MGDNSYLTFLWFLIALLTPSYADKQVALKRLFEHLPKVPVEFDALRSDVAHGTPRQRRHGCGLHSDGYVATVIMHNLPFSADPAFKSIIDRG
jgi:hypothetical protein